MTCSTRKEHRPSVSILGKMRSAVTFDTAGGERQANDGARIQVAWWDGPNDFLLLKDSPSLMSIGSRCQSGQFTFVWVRSKNYACFVDAPRRKIIVFPVRGNIPLFSSRWERTRNSSVLCGSYPLGENEFREQVGVWINAAGQLVLDEPCLGIEEFVDKYSDDPMRRFVAPAPSTSRSRVGTRRA